MEDELRGGGPGGTRADLVGEAEGFCYGQEGEDGEERGAFVEGFRHDAPAAAGYDGVDAA